MGAVLFMITNTVIFDLIYFYFVATLFCGGSCPPMLNLVGKLNN